MEEVISLRLSWCASHLSSSDAEYLAEYCPSFPVPQHKIYDSIKKREIVMPEEHTGQLGFDYAWKELLARALKSGPFLSCNTSSLDADMFTNVSKQVVSSIAYAFTTFNDDYIVQRSIHGFRQLATLAVSFHLPEVFDHIVTALSQSEFSV